MPPPAKFDPLLAVRHHVKARWPRRSSDWIDDVVAEAVRLALEPASALEGEALATAACTQVDRVVRQTLTEARRGHRLSSGGVAAVEPSPEALKPRRRRRSPRKPTTPKGLAPIRFQQPIADYVPNGIGDLPEGSTMLMAHRVSELLRPIARGEPIHPDLRRSLERIYGASFALRPDDAWAEVLLDEIERAKREKLRWEAFNSEGRRTAPPPAESFVAGELLTESGETRTVKIPVTPSVIRDWGSKQLIQLDGVFDNGLPFQSWIINKAEDQKLPMPYDAPSRAARILSDTIHTIARWPAANRLPEYGLDLELIAWLVERMGFDGGGGGGASGTITRTAMGALITNPMQLAAAVENFGRRVAERSNDDDAKVVEDRFNAMAARVRALT